MNKLIPFLQKARIIKEQNQKSFLFWKNNQQLKTIRDLHMRVKYHKLHKSLKKVFIYIYIYIIFFLLLLFYSFVRLIEMFVYRLYLLIGKRQ